MGSTAVFCLAAIVCYMLSAITASSAQWKSATATNSKDTDSSIATEGACGFGDLHKTSYGTYSTALSGILFNRGSSCGACFELRSGTSSIVLTATDFCPPNYALPPDNGGWCNFPKAHFQIPDSSFSLLTKDTVVPIHIHYKRVRCERKGGIRFTLKGSAYFMQVLVTNVGLDGEVVGLKVKGPRTGWAPMARNWGQNWQLNINLAGQPLSFELTTSTRRTLASYNVAPQNWNFGQTFSGKQF
ncbi:Expansin-A20 [Striga hermonthica]|uniref:Expansin n=1 Tax=Striga hermonthica TaxID=68872 RepID=A0A9N7N9Y0_STRHE|nr:Expansin-A20 [Striga hermonthica]